MKNLFKKEKGFTIIEVLIVLAIAGLIILIVFLAVPALQRNSRNTQRKNDVSAVIAAIQETANNNNGKLPANQGELTTAVANAKLSFFDAANVRYTTKSASVASTGNDNVDVIVGAKCAGTYPSQTGTSTGASNRNLAIVYQVETSGSPATACQES